MAIDRCLDRKDTQAVGSSKPSYRQLSSPSHRQCCLEFWPTKYNFAPQCSYSNSRNCGAVRQSQLRNHTLRFARLADATDLLCRAQSSAVSSSWSISALPAAAEAAAHATVALAVAMPTASDRSAEHGSTLLAKHFIRTSTSLIEYKNGAHGTV